MNKPARAIIIGAGPAGLTAAYELLSRSQIKPIVDAMKPDLREVADASAILLAAQGANWGPIQYQGELHDRATYRYFWELLQKAKVTGVTLPEEASTAFF